MHTIVTRTLAAGAVLWRLCGAIATISFAFPCLELENVARATEEAEDPSLLRIYLVLDDSGSTAKSVRGRSRIDLEKQAAEQWTGSLQERTSVTVELLTASDRVNVIGSFAIRSDADRTALLEGIQAIRSTAGTRTLFESVDRGLAEIVSRDTAPDEEFGVVLLTDGISDEPRSDLRASDIGDHVVELGSGVVAVLLGYVPAVEALTPRDTAVRAPVSTTRGAIGKSSAVHALRTGSLRMESDAVIEGILKSKLFGGTEPLHSLIKITNGLGVPRLVRVDGSAPAAVQVRYLPNRILVPAGTTVTVQFTLSADSATEGDVLTTARLPDGRSQQRLVHVHMDVGGWTGEHWWVLVLGALAATLVGGAIYWQGSRPVWIGDHTNQQRQAPLRVGDVVQLATLIGGSVSGYIRRGWFGFQVLAESQAICVAGRLIGEGKRGRYRLGEDIRVGDVTAAVYQTDDTAVTAPEVDLCSSTLRSEGALR